MLDATWQDIRDVETVQRALLAIQFKFLFQSIAASHNRSHIGIRRSEDRISFDVIVNVADPEDKPLYCLRSSFLPSSTSFLLLGM
jgi:hypothetical protein